jgi:hypothetical protein
MIAWLERREGAILAALVAAILAGGCAWAILLGDTVRYYDERDYLALADRLAGGGTYSLDGMNPTAFRPPGYPVALAVPAALGAGRVGQRLVNVALHAACVALLFALLKRHRAGPGAILGAIAGAAYPLFVYAAGTYYPQTMASALLLGVLVLATWGEGGAGTGTGTGTWKACARTAVAGATAGVLVLTVPTFAAPVGIVAAWLLLRRGKGRVLRPAVLVAAAAAVVLPWSVRNLVVMGAPVAVSTNSGRNLLLGNAEGTSMDSGTLVDLGEADVEALKLGEVERDRYYRDAALKAMCADPVGTLRLYGLKLLNYFNYRSGLATASEAAWWKDAVMLATYAPLLALLLIRLALARRFPLERVEWLLLVLYVGNAFLAAVFFTRLRFRIPFDWLLIALDVLFVGRCIAARGTVRET